MERVFAYIDGFNLYFGLKSKGWRRYYWLDLPKLAEQLLRPGQQLLETKYYTSRVSASASDPEKPKRQNIYLEALQTRPHLSIAYGHYLQQPFTCNRCGAMWQRYSEKMTDVNIATEMLTDAFQNSYDTALLISGDSDLTAPIRTVHRLFPQKRVIVVFPPGRRSAELKKVATADLTLGRGTIASSQLPDEITKANGYILRRPKKWN